MRQEIGGLDTRSDAVQSQLAAVQAGIYRGTERLDAFKGAMNWKQEELEKWAAAARQKEEDNLALEKYTRADEVKVKDLSRELERLTAAAAARRATLEAEVTDTKARQVELDKLAEDFRALHAERQALIAQWQESLEAISRRDGDIAAAGERFGRVRAAVAARRAHINEQVALLDRVTSENVELERAITGRERSLGNARESLNALTARVNAARDEVDNLKAEVGAAAAELLHKRAENANYTAQLAEKERQVEVARRSLADIKTRVTEAAAAAAGVESGLAEREEFLRRETQRVEKTERELAALKDTLFRASEALNKLRSEEAAVQAEIAGSRRTSRNLADRIRELDAQAMQQQEHVYAAEFQIQQMERKVRSLFNPEDWRLGGRLLADTTNRSVGCNVAGACPRGAVPPSSSCHDVTQHTRMGGCRLPAQKVKCPTKKRKRTRLALRNCAASWRTPWYSRNT